MSSATVKQGSTQAPGALAQWSRLSGPVHCGPPADEEPRVTGWEGPGVMDGASPRSHGQTQSLEFGESPGHTSTGCWGDC